MSAPSAVGHSKLKYSTLLWFFVFLPGQYRRKISSATAFLFLSSVFFSPFIHFFLFVIPWNTGFFVFPFHLISSSYSLCPNTTALRVMRLARLTFLAAETLREWGSLKQHSCFSAVLHICAGHFPRACFLLLYLIKTRRLPLIPMGVTWCHVGFSAAWNHTSPWWVSESRLALVYVGGWCCQKCHWGVTASADPIWALLGVWTSGSKRPCINNFPSSSW